MTSKMIFADEFEHYCQQHGKPKRIELLLCDINAVLRGKWLPGDQIDKLIQGKVKLPLSTYAPNIMGAEVDAAGLGIVSGDPDGTAIPIANTLKPVPWAKENTAQLVIDLVDENGNISDLSPRHHLQKITEKFAEKQWFPVAATELEFYVIQKRQTPEEPPQAPDTSAEAYNYDMEVLAQYEPMLNEILAACESQDLATDTLIAEYGPGQFEINFHHTDDILKAVDTALLFRRIVRNVVAQHGFEATFMAKPYRQYAGNGMHAHVSIVDKNKHNIFDAVDKQLQASPQLLHAVAGLLDTMREVQVIFAPHMNSLRRFGPNSFAPTSPEWGYDHRGAAVRIPETHGAGARLEHRISGADVNPYLVLTAVLGGILHGLQTQPELPSPLDASTNSQSTPLSSHWADTILAFEESAFAQSLFGENYHRIFTQVKLNELAEISTEISPAEYRLYLSRL